MKARSTLGTRFPQSLRMVPLKYAVEVAHRGSFSAAARALGVTQPTVSAAVAELEERLGVPLFVRTTRAVTLTPQGERVMLLVEASLRALEAVEQEAARLRAPDHPRVRLGFTPLVGSGRVSALVQRFRDRGTSGEVILVESSNEQLESALDGGTLDVAIGFGFRPSKRRGHLALFEDRLRFVRPWAGPRPQQVELHAVARTRLLLTADLCGLATGTRAIFAEAGLSIDVYEGRTMSYGTLEQWAELGLGGAILPECHINNGELHPLLVAAGKPITIIGEAIWRKDLLVGAAAKRFLRYLHETRNTTPGPLRR